MPSFESKHMTEKIKLKSINTSTIESIEEKIVEVKKKSGSLNSPIVRR